jgi:hypothetical protein
LLKKGPDPVDGRLLAFLRVFNMGPGKWNCAFSFTGNCIMNWFHFCVLGQFPGQWVLNCKFPKTMHIHACQKKWSFIDFSDWGYIFLRDPTE